MDKRNTVCASCAFCSEKNVEQFCYWYECTIRSDSFGEPGGCSMFSEKTERESAGDNRKGDVR